MISAKKIIEVSSKKSESCILKAMAYFDIFNYPLLAGEIKKFSGRSIPQQEFDRAMDKLLLSGCVFRKQEFYSLRDDLSLIQKRKEGNERAAKLILKAKKIGAFLYSFPFVRGVAVSGSLSKNYADEKGDIDFFIIATANRLWIARSFLHLFKKFTFLFGKQHLYCMNYFTDEEALAIQEKNIYTATEVVTLLPIAGLAAINKFFNINNWTQAWLPCYMPEQKSEISEKNSFVKIIIERFFARATGDRFDNFLFKWTTRRWKIKEKKGLKNSKGKVMNLITGKHFSKSNPEDFQEKIVMLYENKIGKFKNQWPQYFD